VDRLIRLLMIINMVQATPGIKAREIDSWMNLFLKINGVFFANCDEITFVF
jgi:hypothetical protein